MSTNKDENLQQLIRNEMQKSIHKEVIREELHSKGYKFLEVDTAISIVAKEFESKHSFLSKQNDLFRTLFWIVIGIFVIGLVAVFIWSIWKGDYINLIISIAFGVAIFVSIKTDKIYELLMLSFIVSPLGISALTTIPLIQTFMYINPTLVYFTIAIQTLIIGMISAYLFRKISQDHKKFLKTNIVIASIMGMIFAVMEAIKNIVIAIQLRLAELSGDEIIMGVGTLKIDVQDNFINMNIGFAIAMICLCMPSIIYYLKQKERNTFYLIRYVLPIVIYLILSTVLRYFVLQAI